MVQGKAAEVRGQRAAGVISGVSLEKDMVEQGVFDLEKLRTAGTLLGEYVKGKFYYRLNPSVVIRSIPTRI